MKVIDVALFSEVEEMVNLRQHKVLEILGVKCLDPMDVITHHIVPQFRKNYSVSKCS